MLDRSILAHGLGGRGDLPISPELAITGAVAALAVSFGVLAFAWRSPRYDAGSGRPAPVPVARLVDSHAFATTLRLLGLALFGYTIWVAVWGPDTLANPVFGMFYVLLWVGLVPASLLLGPVWRAISPFRTFNEILARLGGGNAERGLYDYPARLGHWPAAIGLYAFVWTELVYPGSAELGTVRLWILAYVATMMIGGALFGNAFNENADPFEVYSSLVAKLSIWGRRNGRLVVRSPLANLDTLVARPGTVAVVAVLFGSTAFDSFQESVFWSGRTLDASQPLLLDSLALFSACLLVGLVLGAGTAATGVDGDTRRRDLPRSFAHSIVPIVVGYVVAHYLSYLVIVGQDTIAKMSDPMADGSNLFGTAGRATNYWLVLHPTLLATTKVAAVVAGHVLGVVAAHARAIRLLPKRHQVVGQLPLLAAMIAFTVGGLYLLFAS